MQIFIFLALIIAIIAVIFALQNTLIVTVSFIIWKFTGSLALVLLLALAVGALISFLASLPAIVRGKWSLRSLRKQASKLESSITEHKQRLTELESSLTEHKQRLEEAHLKLQTQSAPAQSTENSVQPPDQPAPTA